MRTVRHSFGTRKKVAAQQTTGMRNDWSEMGCSPWNGKSQAETATTTGNGRPSAKAAPRCGFSRQRPWSSSAAATTSRKRPATGLPAVASAEHSTTPVQRAQRARRHASGQAVTRATAASAKRTPMPKVARPEPALNASATAPHTAGTSGCLTARLRARISASRPAESVPAIIIVVRTPSWAMRYGEMML
jgi:hypothetical protein